MLLVIKSFVSVSVWNGVYLDAILSDFYDIYIVSNPIAEAKLANLADRRKRGHSC